MWKILSPKRVGNGARGHHTTPGRGAHLGRAEGACGPLGARLRPRFVLYLPFVVKLFAIYSPGSPEVRISCFRRVLFRAVLAGISSPYMASRGAYGEKYAARRRRELERDVEEGTFIGWATEEEIAARRADMDRSVREEVQAGPSRP